MKEIKLSQGKVALVDDEDFVLLSKYKWSTAKGRNTCYAEHRRRFFRFMHSFLLRPPDNMTVDHIDGNGLNNQRANLRVCSRSHNCQNKITYNPTGYRGVSKRGMRYYSYIRFNKVLTHLGVFLTVEQAALAYNKAALNLYGENARLNTISTQENAK